jgi:cytochrome P450
MASLADRDYFTDHSILRDPYAYFEALRERGPIYRHPETGVVTITGFEEALDVLKDTEHWSSLISTTGAGKALPFEPEGSDINAQMEAHRDKFMGGDLVVTFDDTPHSFSRSLLSKLFTPSKLKANEEFIARYSDELVRNAVADGGVELIKTIATPFVTLVIADLLGVPADDRQMFMDVIENAPPPGNLDDVDYPLDQHPLFVMGTYFAGYVADRRANPRDDVLTELSLATFPDGSTPDAMEVVRLATFLFGAGQDTSAKLLGNAMRFIVEQPGLQDQLRADTSLIPKFLEEVLRLEGSTKMTSRIARRDTSLRGMDMPAGTRVMIALSAANRDPRRWEDPEVLKIGRPKIMEHLGFGRGAHVCIGAPLARVEVRVLLEKFLEHTSSIDLDEAVHGRPGASNLEYEPSFIIRGLAELHLKLTPAADFKGAMSESMVVAKAEGDAPTGWSTGTSTIGALLDHPETLAIVDRHFPGVSSDPQIAMGKTMTFRAVQAFAPDMFTTEKLDAVDEELARLPSG